MMIKFGVVGGFAVLFATILITANAQDTAPTQEVKFSDAETTLWLGDQLAAVTEPLVLTYAFAKTGSFEKGFSDTVVLQVEKLHADGMKAASLEFFTGERRFPLAPEENTNINPVLKAYFQGDVYEMNRLTDPDGKARERWRYFQRRIKFALAEDAKVEPTQFEFDGKRYTGKRVLFTPYARDPKRSEFEQFADKIYSVIVSAELPGFLYKIETMVPAKEASAPLLIQEVLQLLSVAPYKPDS